MTVTEAEAASKWCPQMRALRVFNLGVAAANSEFKDGKRNLSYASCIGSQCMMWAWDTPPIKTYFKSEDPYAEIEPIRPNHVPESFEWEPSEDGEPAYWVEPEAEYMARRQGHCGLVK